MNTATEQRSQKDEEVKRRIFEDLIEHFIRNWAPTNSNGRACFEAQFHGLIRQIYRDAQEPWVDRFTKIMAAMPTIPIIFPPDK